MFTISNVIVGIVVFICVVAFIKNVIENKDFRNYKEKRDKLFPRI